MEEHGRRPTTEEAVKAYHRDLARREAKEAIGEFVKFLREVIEFYVKSLQRKPSRLNESEFGKLTPVEQWMHNFPELTEEDAEKIVNGNLQENDWRDLMKLRRKENESGKGGEDSE